MNRPLTTGRESAHEHKKHCSGRAAAVSSSLVMSDLLWRKKSPWHQAIRLALIQLVSARVPRHRYLACRVAIAAINRTIAARLKRHSCRLPQPEQITGVPCEGAER